MSKEEAKKATKAEEQQGGDPPAPAPAPAEESKTSAAEEEPKTTAAPAGEETAATATKTEGAEEPKQQQQDDATAAAAAAAATDAAIQEATVAAAAAIVNAASSSVAAVAVPEGVAAAAIVAASSSAPALPAVNTEDVKDRDLLFLGGVSGDTDAVAGEDSDSNIIKMNHLLKDVIRLQKVLRKLQQQQPKKEGDDSGGGGPPPIKEESDLDELADRVFALFKKGKPYELAGLKGVPNPFLKSPGRILTATGAGEDGGAAAGVGTKEPKELGDDEAKKLIRKRLFDELSKDDDDKVGPLEESPYKEFKELLQRPAAAAATATEGDAAATDKAAEKAADSSSSGAAKKEDEAPPPPSSSSPAAVVPASKDALLLRCEAAAADKLYEHQMGNKVVFNLASQFVTVGTTDPNSRVEAALNILVGFDEAEIPPGPDEVKQQQQADGDSKASKHPRFLVRSAAEDEDDATWEALSPLMAAEFALTFVFEVVLEKEIPLVPAKTEAQAQGGASASGGESTELPSKEPVPEPTDYDVLFGRGGMTNSHPGNRRFRDIIALHRPDYIRAIKMDKPAVARKIVKAIRQGSPPGRFLKKGEDNLWHDVGDRTAAEKTSQGLRERSNAEKRQRSELRKALRIRKEDLQEDDSAPAAKRVKSESTAATKAAAASIAASTAAAVMPTLNYVGTNLAVPLSLSMTQVVASGGKKKATGSKAKPSSEGMSELNTAGLPPNATDEHGNILVTDHDILCGRGGLTNHHKGNKRFRDIVALHRPDYVRAPKIQKPSVARVIVRAIRNGDPPGRFLRKDEKTGKWVDIGDKRAAEKTSQALREKSNEERDKLRRDPNAVSGVLLPNPASYLAATDLNLAATTASVMGNILASTSEPPKEAAAGSANSEEKHNPVEEPPKEKEVEKKEDQDKSEKKEDEPPLAGEEKAKDDKQDEGAKEAETAMV